MDFNKKTSSNNRGGSTTGSDMTRSICSQLNVTYVDPMCSNSRTQYILGQKTYFLSYTKEKVRNARELCKRSGGDLASFSHIYEVDNAIKLTKSNAGGPIMIGLHADFGWMDGSYSKFRHFSDGEVPTDEKKCVGFYHNDNKDHAKWKYINCEEEFQFLCKGKHSSSFHSRAPWFRT